MVTKVDPFLHPVPPELLQNRETREFFEYFVRWAHDMWVRSGGGNDDIANAQIEESFPWDLSDNSGVYSANVSMLYPAHDSQPNGLRAVSVSTDYTALPFEFVNATLSATVTFPQNPQENDIIVIRNGDGSTINIDGNGRTINGSLTGTLAREGTAIEFYYFIGSDEWLAK